MNRRSSNPNKEFSKTWTRPYQGDRGHSRNQEEQDLESSWKEDKIEDVKGLVALPDLATEWICTFLNKGDLLTLRQVCQATKSWVESSPILCTICVEIKRPNHLEYLLKDKRTINFTNVKFQLEKIASQTMLSIDFIKEYGPGLRVLRITSASGFFRKFDILLGCAALEVVQISDLSFRNIPPEDISSFGERFRNYREFRLDDLMATTEAHVCQMLGWISHSTKLEHLRLPQLQFENGEPKEEDFFLKKIIIPLIEVVKRRRALKTLDLERICFSIVNKEAVQKLAVACQQFKVKLLNVPFSQLDAPSLSKWEQYSKGLEAIASIKGYQPGKIDTTKLTNVHELTLSIGFILASERQDVDIEAELELPNLKKLKIDIFCMEEEISRSIVSALLVRRVRENVTDLFTAWNLNRPSPTSYVCGMLIGHSFPNLKRLELLQYGGSSPDFRDMFQAMTNLEEITIRDCKALSDEAFCGRGNDISPFRLLKKLRKVHIRCYDYGVTDMSLREAFAILPLRSLSINFIGFSFITLKGLHSLVRLPFKNTIQYLSLQLDKAEYPDVKRVTNQFKNMKKCQFN